MTKPAKANTHEMLLQLVVNVFLPLVILTKLSSKDQLGQVGALLLALAMPVMWELYRVVKHRRLSRLSLFAIGGIVLTGGISLLGLSEEWLAVRRSALYIIGGLVLLGMIYMKKQPIDLLLSAVVDTDMINSKIQQRKKEAEYRDKKRTSIYALAVLLLVVGVASYVLTRVVIVHATNTESFNTEYARLRLLSVPFITVPLVVGATAILMYLLTSIEKLSGLELDKIIHKK
ncbi:hypothetical protein JNM87_04000 [Candidatus Saccharibacteria bacterium]|nr:hypothetical protein [Candidatus Saccharibacteria bacterium]